MSMDSQQILQMVLDFSNHRYWVSQTKKYLVTSYFVDEILVMNCLGHIPRVSIKFLILAIGHLPIVEIHWDVV